MGEKLKFHFLEIFVKDKTLLKMIIAKNNYFYKRSSFLRLVQKVRYEDVAIVVAEDCDGFKELRKG